MRIVLALEVCDADPLGLHGGTATVWVKAPFGTMIAFEPGGVCELAAATCASEHGGTTTRRLVRCCGITTVRTPGVWSAVVTGSLALLDADFEPPPELELDELEPHAPKALASVSAAETVTSARTRPWSDTNIEILPQKNAVDSVSSRMPYPERTRQNRQRIAELSALTVRS